MTLNGVKTFFILIGLGMLVIGILVAGFFVGLILTIILPIIAVFTGLWIWWFVANDHKESASDSGSDD